MIRLNEKEKEYISLQRVSPRNEKGEGVAPDYRIVDWLKAKNISERVRKTENIHTDSNGILDFTREVTFSSGRTTSLDIYIESILVRQDVEVKGLDGPISHAFG